MQTTDYLVTFLAGLGVGAAAALLFAPASGVDTRRRISDMASRTGDTLKEQAESIGQTAAAARNTVDRMVDKSRDVAHTAGRVMEERGRQLQNA